MINPDSDELGLDDDIRIGTFVDMGSVGDPGTIAFDKWEGMASAMGTRVSINTLDAVEAFEIDLGGGATMIAVAGNGFVRDRSSRVQFVNTPNERSLCFLVRFGGFDYLIGGDMTGRADGGENAKVEEAVGDFLEAEGISIDVLHAGHHGADNASEEVFLGAIQPEVAIVSVGNKNSHGHPTKGALDRLQAAGVVAIVQTELGQTEDSVEPATARIISVAQGDVFLSTDGASYTISTRRAFNVDE